MYNRYIPSGDGSYICQPVAELPPLDRGSTEPIRTAPAPQSPCGSLRLLLPSNLETDDLLILLILLLLLLDREDGADSTTALVAAAAFLILQ